MRIVDVNGQECSGKLYTEGYWYLASPYSKYEDGLDKACEDIAEIAGWLMANGVVIYSPIAHSHVIAIAAGLNPLISDLWIKQNLPMMQTSTGCLVTKMKGWKDSVGTRAEIRWYEDAGKPIYFVELK